VRNRRNPHNFFAIPATPNCIRNEKYQPKQEERRNLHRSGDYVRTFSLNNNNNLVENARDTGASEQEEAKKLYFNKHFSVLYVYDHLDIYARLRRRRK
jgi:hypothetical protein